MDDILSGIQPEVVFKHFETLTRIPRGSGNEKAVSDYLVHFAKLNNLEVIQDESLNVIIYKPGTKGHENAKTVILQGHMDMVCVKKEDIDFNFETEAIPLVIDGDRIKTKGTTLGADNGIAVAMCMAILESKELVHPPLTVLITVEEETGMNGVMNLKKEHVKGEILINLDSEEEGVFLSSCAGGVRNIIQLPIEYKKVSGEFQVYELSISGLLGGHSGMEINKNRANAIKLLGRVLYSLNEQLPIELVLVSGGEKMNAIAKLAKAVILIDEEKLDDLNNMMNDFNKNLSNEYKNTDPKIKVEYHKVESTSKVFSDVTKQKVISLLRLLPTGVQTMSGSIQDLVESSMNIGVLETKGDMVTISSSIRSSVRSLKYEMCDRIKSLCHLVGAKNEFVSDYPEWEYKTESPIRELMLRVYKEMFNKDAEVKAIHAGLECGYLKDKLGDIDMISLGPNMVDVHTPQEQLSISSTKNVYEFLCKVLSNM